ncbi:MAG TPA: hypothetical protein EYP68_00035, partial [Candidatus Korarchaeota archaeon]|nr:hypothetical protein [Candidatus Korarchaeota archaeon]
MLNSYTLEIRIIELMDGIARLDLSSEQEDVIGETFTMLIEGEVTRRVAPWAYESMEQKGKEAKNWSFLEFFDAVLKDWTNYLHQSRRYPTISDFIREEVIERKK